MILEVYGRREPGRGGNGKGLRVAGRSSYVGRAGAKEWRSVLDGGNI